MVQLKMDDEMSAILEPIKEEVEVINSRGILVGYFIPALSPQEELRRKAFAEYDPDVARMRRDSPEGGFTTGQVQAHLKNLGVS